MPRSVVTDVPTSDVTRRRPLTPGTITRRAQARHGLSEDCDVLYVGTVVVPLVNVASYKAVGLSEKDLSTAFATIAIFSGVAAVYAFGVVELGWRARQLLEGVLFGAIAMCAVAELFSARRDTLYTFKIVLDGGDVEAFVTADTNEAHAVKAALDAAVLCRP